MLRLVERAHGEAVHRNAPRVVLIQDGCAPGSENQLGRLLGAGYMVSLRRGDSAGIVARSWIASYSMG